MTTCLDLVSEQFPHLKERVASLFKSDAVFRELCEDYETCTVTLTRQTAQELRREYAALRLRLETELLAYLHEDSDPPSRRK
jgi:hypothetical protein